jgi:hypothetical protein
MPLGPNDIELGSSNDTTLSRLSAGVAAVEGKMIYATGAVSLTGSSTGTALDASLGSVFTAAATGDWLINAPSNPQAGQKITIIFKASGANRTASLSTAAGGFSFGTDITALSVTTSSLSDYIGCMYPSTAVNTWHVVAYVKGY